MPSLFADVLVVCLGVVGLCLLLGCWFNCDFYEWCLGGFTMIYVGYLKWIWLT